MSGGVDSTVAAHLLQAQGHEVEGVTFWLWAFPEAPDLGRRNQCCSLDDAAIAAAQLGVSHRVVNGSDAFHDNVVHDYVTRYRRGETPNPCGRCNRMVRFGLALDIAAEEGFDLVATGHHARVLRDENGRPQLHRGVDPRKDQSYFLYGLAEPHLEQLAFPVGEMTKKEVLAHARAHALHAASLPESQDLCFAPGGLPDALFDPCDLAPGPILDADGKRLGTHNGLPRYTIGQRRGLGVASERPLYVVAIDRERNALRVGGEEELASDGLVAAEASFVDGRGPEDNARVEVKLRYRSPAVDATVRRLTNDRFALSFDAPQRAVTPGQLAVLYDGDRLLGGGTIVEATRDA